MTAIRVKRTPSYRRHKPTGRAVVELDGQRIYLGKFGTAESRERYDRLIAEWLAGGRKMPVAPDDITIVELCERYLDHARIHYRSAGGKLTSEFTNMKLAIRELRQLYGRTRCRDFGPLGLKAVRTRFIESGLSRSTCNRYVSAIKRVIKWGVAEGFVPFEVFGALQAVEGLRRGRTEAKETEPVRPVREADIDAVRLIVSRQVRALIDLQLLTGARPGELLNLRAVDFDTSESIWTVTPRDHKTSHAGRARVIYFGPRAQAIVRDFMRDRALHEHLFSAREAEAERHANSEKNQHRRPNQKPNAKMTDRVVGETYSTGSYRKAIARACTAVNATRGESDRIEVWSPNQLRHNAATFIRKESVFRSRSSAATLSTAINTTAAPPPRSAANPSP